jgi:hypothetical protein
MRCAHCREAPASVTKFPYRNANKSVGVDLLSDCCWAELLDEQTDKPLTDSEIEQALRAEEQEGYVPTES